MHESINEFVGMATNNVWRKKTLINSSVPFPTLDLEAEYSPLLIKASQLLHFYAFRAEITDSIVVSLLFPFYWRGK